MAETVYYLVPTTWLQALRAWIRKPNHTQRPGSLINGDLFCPHNQLFIDVTKRAEWTSRTLLVEDEWIKLTGMWVSPFCEIGVIIM